MGDRDQVMPSLMEMRFYSKWTVPVRLCSLREQIWRGWLAGGKSAGSTLRKQPGKRRERGGEAGPRESFRCPAISKGHLFPPSREL